MVSTFILIICKKAYKHIFHYFCNILSCCFFKNNLQLDPNNAFNICNIQCMPWKGWDRGNSVVDLRGILCYFPFVLWIFVYRCSDICTNNVFLHQPPAVLEFHSSYVCSCSDSGTLWPCLVDGLFIIHVLLSPVFYVVLHLCYAEKYWRYLTF